jgi:hypothetical protein
MIDTVAFFLFIAFSTGSCMHSAYRLGYTKGYQQGKLIAFMEELDRTK